MRHRTLFLSDIHLGTRGCQAEMIIDFLQHHSADTIYLIGDICDGWRLKRGWHWPQLHNDLIEVLLARAHSGVRIFYIPGNHDAFMRAYYGTHFGGIEVTETADFTSKAGKRYLVTHGDQFDNVVMYAKWLAHLGDRAYVTILWLNTWFNRMRWIWGGQYWSLSKWAKHQVKRAVNFISDYEAILADAARRGGYDGVICGHIHHANISEIDGVEYINTGDWVESCTAVYEDEAGELVLVDWAETLRNRDKGQSNKGPKDWRLRPTLQRRRDREKAK
ncbi:MAG: UDP-2,3-diacylglucosamine diphosphatase [Pseudomonadota bacterium]